jgi:uncharacterized protein (DUF305 family)
MFKYLLLAFVFSMAISKAITQEHSMHMSHPMEPVPKNVYLIMMDTMMARMESNPKGRSPEEEFFLQMIPHHMGAVDMANYEIAHGKNFEIVQLAKSILAEQQSELTAMQLWLKSPNNISSAVDSNFSNAMAKSMFQMMNNIPNCLDSYNTDRCFAIIMIPHHQAAVDMAKAVLNFSKNADTLPFAKMLISNEQIEIQQMLTYINTL